MCPRPAASRQSFKEQEGLVNQQLAQLIRDGVWLKSYLAAVMRLEAEAFQQARRAILHSSLLHSSHETVCLLLG